MIKRLLLLTMLACHFSLMAQQTEVSDETEATAAEAPSAYISDDLFIYMHSGPGTNYRIVGSVTAGTAISILNTDSDAGFTEISDDRDRTGWVKSEFVADSSLRSAVTALESQLEAARASTEDQSDAILRLESQLRAAEQTRIEMEQRLEQQLRETSRLEQQLSLQTSDAEKEMFYRGGIVAGSGALAGILLTFLLRRKKRSDSLYDRY